jgi:hypothetical protein
MTVNDVNEMKDVKGNPGHTELVIPNGVCEVRPSFSCTVLVQ